ncbi:HNH endonuclease [bacterium]|nr:MAG: HNH endonuclease [bacterium]
MSVLVLNASNEPLNVVSTRRAIVLLLKDKAKLVEAAGASVRSERVALPTPLVIRLVAYVRIPHHWRLPVSRRGVLARDLYTCQYCGRQPGRRGLTIDHVVPRAQNGPKSWENLVAACIACNRRKGGRRPHEAGMRLSAQPFVPRLIAVAFVTSATQHASWEKYFRESGLVLPPPTEDDAAVRPGQGALAR